MDFALIYRALLSKIPGTKLNMAAKKRALEKDLRRCGSSRKEATRAAAERFKRRAD